MKDLKFIMKYSKPYAYKVFAILIDVIIYVTGLLVAPLILSYMIDNIIHGIPIEQGIVAVAIDALGGVDFLRNNLWIGGILVVFAYGMVALGIHRRARNCGILSETFSENLRNSVYNHMQKLPFSYHKMKDSGDLLQRSTSDIDTIRRFLSGQISELLYSIIIIGLSATVLFTRNVKLALIALCLTPVTFIATAIF